MNATRAVGASLVFAATLVACAATRAQGSGAAPAPLVAPPQGVLNLAASASVEVAQDLLSITFSTTREGADAAGVQSALKQALDAALAESRKAARPQQVEVKTGNFSLYPRYSAKGALNGWQGSAQLLVEGRDMSAIAQLAGRLQTMSVQRVAYGLSREAREAVEADVTAQAITRFKAKAAETAKQFGYASATIREVNVSLDEPGNAPVPMMRMRESAAYAADSALPVEAGKATVTASVSGSVQMRMEAGAAPAPAAPPTR